MLLTLQDRHGVRWAHPAEVASIAPAHPERWRVVLKTGEVAYSVTRPALGERWVNPGCLRDGKDPAGFPRPEGAAEGMPEEPLEPGVLWLKRQGGKRWWCEDEGEHECELSWKEALANYPELVSLGGGIAANRRRFRRIRPERARAILTLDNGLEVVATRSSLLAGLARELELDRVDMIDARLPPVLFRLRDYPYELARASREQLRSEFDDASDLALNLLWQTAQFERDRVAHDYGRDVASYFQHPILSTLARAGYGLRWHHFQQNLLGRLIENYELLTYGELGFRAPAERCWELGSRQPELVLVVADQAALKEPGRALAREQGMSFYQIQAKDNPIHREFFLGELKRTTDRPVRWLAWVNAAPYGKNDVELLRRGAERRGLEAQGKTGYLVVPEDSGTSALQLLPLERARERLHELLQQQPPLEPVEPAPRPEGPRRLAMQDPQGVHWVAFEQVASLTPAYPNRWRAVLADGRLAYLPDPLPTTTPWVRLGESWVRPELLRREGEHWVDPAGFRLPYRALPPAPSAAPASALDDMLVLEQREGDVFWHRQAGRVAARGTLLQEAARHPSLVRVHKYRYVHRNRLSQLFLKGNRGVLRLDTGLEIEVRPDYQAAELARQLGLGSSFGVFNNDRLFHFWLRDFPFELARAPGPVLKAAFPRAVELIANTLFQAGLYRRTGGPTYPQTLRDFFYFPLSPMLQRGGFLPRFPARLEAYFSLFRSTVHRFVYGYRLFNYRQLGFEPQKGDHELGTTRPEVLLILEKAGVAEDYARRLARQHGVSLVLTEGQPSLMASERLVEALGARGVKEVRVVAYVDFDCYGWMIAEAFVKQLTFYGCRVVGLQHLVVPQLFRAEELELFARPLKLTTPAIATKVQQWIERGGGIGGQPLGLHLDTLQPYERIEAAFEELMRCW